MEDVLPFLIPILALMIPIVVILTRHQQKMAEILRSDATRPTVVNPEMELLRQEMRMLRETVNQQTIQMDNMLNARKAPPADDVRVNLGG